MSSRVEPRFEFLRICPHIVFEQDFNRWAHLLGYLEGENPVSFFFLFLFFKWIKKRFGGKRKDAKAEKMPTIRTPAVVAEGLEAKAEKRIRDAT